MSRDTFTTDDLPPEVRLQIWNAMEADAAHETTPDPLPAHAHDGRICVVPNCPQLALDQARDSTLSNEGEDAPSRRHWRECRDEDLRSVGIILWGCAAFFGLIAVVAAIVAHAIVGGRP